MAGTGPTIVAKFIADTSKLTTGVDTAATTAGSKLDGFAKKASLAIGGAFAVDKIVDFAKGAVNAASDLGEATSKVGVVFGDQATGIEDWAKTAATSMGLSEEAALSAAGTYGNLAVSLGLPQEEAANMSTSLVGLAADLGSFNNVPVDEALQALQSGLTGETEPLKKFGINLNAAAIEAEALALGISDGSKPLTAAQKAQASYSLILKNSATAQGDFARTSDGLANQNKIASAQFADMQATLGKALLPILTKLVGFLNDWVIPAITSLSEFISDNIGWLGPLGIAVGGVTAAVFLWNAAMAANPIVLVTLAIAALVAGIIYAYENVEIFRTIVDAAWKVIKKSFEFILDAVMAVYDWIKDHWKLLLAILTGPIGAAVLLITTYWDEIKGAALKVYEWLRDTWDKVSGFITAPIKAGIDAAKVLWVAISTAAQVVIDWITNTWSTVTALIKAPISAGVDAAKLVWSGISTAAQVVIDWFKGTWDTISGFITLPITTAVGTIKGLFNDVKTAMTGTYDWIKEKIGLVAGAIEGVVSSVATAIGKVVSAIKAPINAVIGAWNNLTFSIPKVSTPKVHVPGTNIDFGGEIFGGKTWDFPDLPTLAKGGVLTRPTMFIGGEAGTEIVAPEAMLRQIMREEGRGGGYTLNVYPRTADAADIAYGFRRLELMAGVR